LALVIGRSLPILFQEQLYSCQTFIQSLTIDVLTCQIRDALLVGLGGLLSFILLRIGTAYFMIQKQVRAANKWSQPARLKHLISTYQLTNQVVQIDNPQPTAFCFGLYKPRIYISSTLVSRLSTPELAAVLLHEQHHLKKSDSLTLFIAALLQMCFPFFPVLADLSYRYRLQAELEADQAAISGLGDKKPLLSVLKKMLLSDSTPVFATAALSDRTLSTRIEYLTLGTLHQPTPSMLSTGISLLSVGCLIGLLFLPAQATASESQSMNQFCIGGTTCAIRCSTTPVQATTTPPSMTPVSGMSLAQ
jgi:beta-lactamase regulating signal transducer with metallopeptidase domain